MQKNYVNKIPKGVLIFYPENRVAPFAGAWIEIVARGIPLRFYTSLPSRERGLKC